MRKALFLAVLVSLGLTLVLEAAGVKGNGSPDKAKPKQNVDQLIDQLGHRKYRTREAAQKALAKMGVEALPILVKARKTRMDLEVLRRLDAVIPNLERLDMVRPKLVSLHMNNKSIQEVLAEITKQTGYHLDIQNANLNNKALKFNFDKLPFWQALDKVCQEANLSVNQYHYYGNTTDRIQLTSYGTKPGPYVQYTETFRLVPISMNYSRNVNYDLNARTDKAAQHTRQENMYLSFHIFTEPKLPFMQVHSPVITEAYDEHKKPMFVKTAVSPNPNPYYDRYYYGNYRFLTSQQSVYLIRPSRDSKRAKIIRGEIPVTVLRKEQELVVVDKPLTIKQKKMFKGGKTEMEIEDVTEANNWGNGKSYTVKMNIKEDSDTPNADWNWQNSLMYRLVLMDAKGNKYTCWNNNLYNPGNRGSRFAQGSITFSPPNQGIGEPVKLVYLKWVTEQHRIKFEFKNVPLP
jgi:hypothetical protein